MERYWEALRTNSSFNASRNNRVSLKSFFDGGNPYDGAQCVEAMQRADYPEPEHVATGSFYPPPTIAVLSPLGLMGWDAARLIWLAINLACCGMLVWALASWLKIESALQR